MKNTMKVVTLLLVSLTFACATHKGATKKDTAAHTATAKKEAPAAETAKAEKKGKKAKKEAAAASETKAAGENGPWTCTKGGDVRTIEVKYPNAGAKLPCEVSYTKGGETKALFTAANEEGFCHTKAHAFMEKLTGLGFTCK